MMTSTDKLWSQIEKAGGTLNILKKIVSKQGLASIAKKLSGNDNTSKK